MVNDNGSMSAGLLAYEHNIHPSTDVRTPTPSSRWAPSPIRGLVASAVRAMYHVPRPGVRQSWTEIKVRKDEAHPCVVLDRILCDAVSHGVPMEEALGIPRSLAFGVRVLYGAVPTFADPTAAYRVASLRETRAESRVNPLQLQAHDLDAMSDLDLDRLAAFWDEQIEAAMECQLAVQTAQHRRMERRAARTSSTPNKAA